MRRMLVVEDSDISDLYRIKFQGDFHVTVARDGATAMAIAEQDSPFDIAIVDVIMPVESQDLDYSKTGIRIIRKLIELQKCQRFLVISVNEGAKESIRKGLSKDVALTFASKNSIQPEQILAEINELCARKLG